MPASNVVEVGGDVFCATGTDVNWVLIRDGADVTMIDSGYPRDTAAVEASLRAIGSRPEDVRAILLTHAHIDHMGGVHHFHAEYGTPVFASGTEVVHARREYLEQADPATVTKNSWRPGVLAWSLRIVRAGALSKRPFEHATALPGAGGLDLPGKPEPIPTKGHTSGHTAYYLPSIGAITTGDGLVTGHPTSRMPGPQVLATMFNHCSPADSLDGLAALADIDAGIVIPGHGAPLHAPIKDVVDTAKASVSDRRYW